ncbi:MAG: peptidase M28 [Flavobacteriales bacterium]|nr:peptidase M28 [Flavobacteriales bacterium]|tara:strand:- start:146 stop:1363 length:1218 start_codon:yes stop_codon:yes gene_type:complete
MKKITVLLILISFNTLSQNQKEITINQMRDDVKYLSSDKLKGRQTGSKSEKKAAKYIINNYQKKLLIKKGEKGYIQKFNKKFKPNPHSSIESKEITVSNVIGYCDNNQPKTVIIGAHYDHIGFGEYGSRYTGEKAIHNGADDNASGVSIMLNLIDKLCPNNLYNYLFIAFSGEEMGLIGSSYFVENPTINLSMVEFMINFDMVGRLNEENGFAINGVGTSSKWNKLIDETNENYNYKIIKSESGIGPSDHSSFYTKDIPVLHFFTGQHEDYHTPDDDIDKINFNGMYLIMDFVNELIKKSKKIKNFDFQETVNNSNTMTSFNVTLGIMPNYLYDGEGLKIDGVIKNKTAYVSGLLKGDIIQKMGEMNINDIYKYMEALNQFSLGDTTNVTINRDGEIFNLPIIFK